MNENIGKFEFRQRKEKPINGLAYFLGFAFWIPLGITAFRFWWDFFVWLFQ